MFGQDNIFNHGLQKEIQTVKITRQQHNSKSNINIRGSISILREMVVLNRIQHLLEVVLEDRNCKCGAFQLINQLRSNQAQYNYFNMLTIKVMRWTNVGVICLAISVIFLHQKLIKYCSILNVDRLPTITGFGFRHRQFTVQGYKR